MLWLIIIISAYFLFAITALVDKFLLAGAPNPKNYTFYIGVLGILAFLLAPFVGFFVPGIFEILLALGAGALFLLGLFAFYTALEYHEASRVVPAIGGILPLFTFGFTLLLGAGKVLTFYEVLAFFLLISGSVLMTLKKKKTVTLKSLPISIIAAFLFALSLVGAKLVYLLLPFWTGFIWMRIGGFLAAMFFIFTPEVKKEIFQRKSTFKKKTGLLFLFNAGIGAGASVLQSVAIALVPLSLLAFVTALEGTKYIFLLLFASLIAFKFPKLLKEEASKKALSLKIVAVLLIGIGLALLAF